MFGAVLAAAVLAAAAPVRAPGIDRGAHVAQRDCALCHAVGPTGRSPNFAAPPFARVRLRYNPISLERALTNISKHGHFEMRPQRISSSDVADLAAYIQSLAPPAN